MHFPKGDPGFCPVSPSQALAVLTLLGSTTPGTGRREGAASPPLPAVTLNLVYVSCNKVAAVCTLRLMSTDSSSAGLVPGTPKNTCARCRPRRRWPDLGVPRVAACPHTTARSPPAPSRCHKSPRPAVYPWAALRRVRNVGAQDCFGTFAASVPSLTTLQQLFSRWKSAVVRGKVGVAQDVSPAFAHQYEIPGMWNGMKLCRMSKVAWN